MDIRIQELPFVPAALRGLSDKLLRSHHQNNYGGAVKRLNTIRAQLSALDFAAAPGFQVNWLNREELIATNSMLLHELYFGSLGGDGQTMMPAMTLALEANFGAVERRYVRRDLAQAVESQATDAGGAEQAARQAAAAVGVREGA